MLTLLNQLSTTIQGVACRIQQSQVIKVVWGNCIQHYSIHSMPINFSIKLTAYIPECLLTVVYATKAADATAATAICTTATCTERYQWHYKHRHRVHT